MLARPGGRDDRGRRHPRPADGPDWRQAGVGRLEEIGFWFAQATIFFTVVGLVSVFGLVAVSLLVEEVLELHHLIRAIAATVVPAVLGLGAAIVVIERTEKLYYTRRLLPLLRRRRLCANCRYEIGRIPAEADGCTVCPECGAAWRLGD